MMSTTNFDRYMVNFLRDRDAYHVPAALHACGLLHGLVTDVYFDNTSPYIRDILFSTLRDHSSELLKGARTHNAYLSVALQALDKYLVKGRWDVSFASDQALGMSTRNHWRRSPSSLLLYSGYALEAFREASHSEARKLLFLFHPHHALVTKILTEDMDRFPQFRSSFENDLEVKATWRHRRADEELVLADGIIAASQFSLDSASHFGTKAQQFCVPYFSEVFPNHNAQSLRSRTPVRFLFVGQGIQRKGLHHLFEAWRRAALTGATLTCVCSRMHQSIAGSIPPGVEVKSNLTKAALQTEFDRAHVFVMPSLIEGFGLVYLEAQRRGAYVIGTSNTGLPDITRDSEIASSVTPGDIDALTEALQTQRDRAALGQIDHQGIVSMSERYGFQEYVEMFNRILSAIPAR